MRKMQEVGREENDDMVKKTKKPTQKIQAWIEARKRHHLSHAQVHMARELGMNPSKLGKIDNHKQEPWKLPLPQFIEELYFKRFGKSSPEAVLSIEERYRREAAKKEERRLARRLAVGSAAPREAPRGSGEQGTCKSSAGLMENVGLRPATLGDPGPQS
jgi:hypothetical protein